MQRGQRRVGRQQSGALSPGGPPRTAAGGRGTESAELQRIAKLIAVAAAALYGGEIGAAECPVLDQLRFSGGQGEQLLELFPGKGLASRHGKCPK